MLLGNSLKTINLARQRHPVLHVEDAAAVVQTLVFQHLDLQFAAIGHMNIGHVAGMKTVGSGRQVSFRPGKTDQENM